MRVFFSSLFFLVSIIGFAQQTSRLRIESGSSVYFYFNSYEKIKNGIVYKDWTKLSIYYNDSTNVTQWILEASTYNGVNSIQSETSNAANDLDLATIELKASGDALNTYKVLSPLSAVGDWLAYGPETSPGTTKVYITYQCGVNSSYTLWGKKTDYFYVDIVLTLRHKTW